MLEIAVNGKQLRAALAAIERAERNGFHDCLAVLAVENPASKDLAHRTAAYSDLWERADPRNPAFDWGRDQQVSRANRFVDGTLVPIPEEWARMAKEPINRTGWTAGPWDQEPDRLEWKDATTGLTCLAVRNRFGAWCGYVGVPPTHAWHGKEYDAVDAEVHGGLTYAGRCSGPICHTPVPGEPDDIYWFGFDCNHGGDQAPGMDATMRRYRGDAPLFPGAKYRTLEYVQGECASLALQLGAAK